MGAAQTKVSMLDQRKMAELSLLDSASHTEFEACKAPNEGKGCKQDQINGAPRLLIL